jgi:hypothetical protein
MIGDSLVPKVANIVVPNQCAENTEVFPTNPPARLSRLSDVARVAM